MRAGRGVTLGALIAVLVLTACGSRDQPARLMNLRSPHEGPDEFGILPPKPLTIPADLTVLPEPTPGGNNLTDPNPMADAIIALGGRPGAGGGDAALVAAAGRYGISPTVREDLAAEDRAQRARRSPRLLERLFGTSVYHRAYEGQTVRQYDELERWRAEGRRTPAVPPDPSVYRDLRR